MKFCANSLCAFHTEAGDNNCLDWDIGHKRVQVRQLTIVDDATGCRLALCEVCANAVAIANELGKGATSAAATETSQNEPNA